MSITETLNWRYATKEFNPQKKISKSDFAILLEVLRLAPSSFGLQPWKFVVVENPSLREQLLPKSWNQKQVVDASHLIVFCRPSEFGENHIDQFLASTAKIRKVELDSLAGYGKMMKGFIKNMNESELKYWMKGQIYIALGHFLCACAHLNIDACPMEGFSPKDYDQILDLHAKGLESVVVCPVGYRSSADKYAGLAKVRYPLDELVIRI